jgi:hypothetical protein
VAIIQEHRDDPKKLLPLLAQTVAACKAATR